MEIKTIFVVGAGLMGSGISQICAQAGFNVIMNDTNDNITQKGMESIKWSAGKLVEKGKVEGTLDEIIGRIKTTTDLKDAKDADFVFEAIFENLDVKKKLFAELDQICPAHTILASNSSAIPITEISVATKRADKCVGVHFFSPVPMMRVAEVIKGVSTSDETFLAADDLCKKLGKETVKVNRDVAGFALNRMNHPSMVEAIKLVESGVVSVEDMDKGVRLGFGRAMGPFETADMAGLDVGYNAMSIVYRETQDEKVHPPVLLQRKVQMGHFGKKTGIGWYKYDEKGNKIGPAD